MNNRLHTRKEFDRLCRTMRPMLGPSTSAYGNPPAINPPAACLRTIKVFQGRAFKTHLSLWLVLHLLSFPHAYRSFLFYFLGPRVLAWALIRCWTLYIYILILTSVVLHSLFYIRWKNAFPSCVSLYVHYTTLIHRHP